MEGEGNGDSNRNSYSVVQVTERFLSPKTCTD